MKCGIAWSVLFSSTPDTTYVQYTITHALYTYTHTHIHYPLHNRFPGHSKTGHSRHDQPKSTCNYWQRNFQWQHMTRQTDTVQVITHTYIARLSSSSRIRPEHHHPTPKCWQDYKMLEAVLLSQVVKCFTNSDTYHIPYTYIPHDWWHLLSVHQATIYNISG